jgi:hypothetical protein
VLLKCVSDRHQSKTACASTCEPRRRSTTGRIRCLGSAGEKRRYEKHPGIEDLPTQYGQKTLPARCPTHEPHFWRRLMINQAREILPLGQIARIVDICAAEPAVPTTITQPLSRNTSAGRPVAPDTAPLLRQAFLFDRSHPPFRMRVQIPTPGWQANRFHPSRFDQFTKRCTELRISVMQQILAVSQTTGRLTG